jgi:hypothetical protein
VRQKRKRHPVDPCLGHYLPPCPPTESTPCPDEALIQNARCDGPSAAPGRAVLSPDPVSPPPDLPVITVNDFLTATTPVSKPKPRKTYRKRRRLLSEYDSEQENTPSPPPKKRKKRLAHNFAERLMRASVLTHGNPIPVLYTEDETSSRRPLAFDLIITPPANTKPHAWSLVDPRKAKPISFTDNVLFSSKVEPLMSLQSKPLRRWPSTPSALFDPETPQRNTNSRSRTNAANGCFAHIPPLAFVPLTEIHVTPRFVSHSVCRYITWSDIF